MERTYTNQDTMPRPAATQEDRYEIAQQIWGLYKAGARLWTKEQFIDAEEQLYQTSPYVVMDGMDGNKYRVRRIGCLSKDREEMNQYLALDFRTIQDLLQGIKGRQAPMAFCTVMTTCVSDGEKRPEPEDLGTIARRWMACDQAWLQSATCSSLVRTLSSVPMPVHVDKIVCFGLGDLGRQQIRPHFQHLAALTMAEVLKSRTNENIRVLLQEPDYSLASKQFLRYRGFTVIDGCARGFVEVDERTLVFTVAPNVPVKQIVTELARPAVMVWNAAHEFPEVWAWEGKLPPMKPEEDRMMRVFETDPNSPRVRDMLRDEYTIHPFPPDPQNFGVLDICVKNS